MDLALLKQQAEGEGSEPVQLTRRLLRRMIAEIEEGRKASAELAADRAVAGLVFGLGPGRRL